MSENNLRKKSVPNPKNASDPTDDYYTKSVQPLRKVSVPMFKKLSIDFELKEKTAFLEHHKTALKELRQFKRVIEKSEIDEHAQTYL